MQSQQNYKGVLHILLVVAMMLVASSVFAQSAIDISGTDKSQNLSTLNDLAKTGQSLLFKTIAPLTGCALGFWAIISFVKREIFWGVIQAVCCGACFFLDKLIGALAKMGS